MTTARSSSDVPADQRAIVIGASIAGLLAARVLSERYPDVLLLERDPLPEQAAPRKGTPQAVHPHGLLARGLQVMEELFPGFTDTLVARGALSGDIAHVARDHGTGGKPIGDRGRTATAGKRLAGRAPDVAGQHPDASA
jgi:2-polyprenyl-6-methoxyphenol hydroxylase-like FAD-dependent oxidoreductase